MAGTIRRTGGRHPAFASTATWWRFCRASHASTTSTTIAWNRMLELRDGNGHNCRQTKSCIHPAPKVACTSIKRMFYRIENEREFISGYRNSISFNIHDYYPTPPFGKVPHSKIRDHFRICVVRDPIRRFLSGYSNRVVFHRELRKELLSYEAMTAGAAPNPTLDLRWSPFFGQIFGGAKLAC